MRQWFDLKSQCMVIFWPKKVKFQQFFVMHLYSHVVHQNAGNQKANKFKPIFYKYFGGWDNDLTSKVSASSFSDPKRSNFNNFFVMHLYSHVVHQNVGIKKANKFKPIFINILVDEKMIWLESQCMVNFWPQRSDFDVRVLLSCSTSKFRYQKDKHF